MFKTKTTRPRIARKKTKTGIPATSGTLSINGLEYLGAVTSAATGTSTVNSFKIEPGATGVARLDSFSGLFELYRFKQLQIEYRPAVGTTVDGIVHVGVDYDPSDVASTVAMVSSRNPVMSVPVWKSGRIAATPDRLNKGKWMYTSQSSGTHTDLGAACSIEYGLNHGENSKTFGELWLKYEMEFCSPTLASVSECPPCPPTPPLNELGGSFATCKPFTFSGGAGGNVSSLGKTSPNANQIHIEGLSNIPTTQAGDWISIGPALPVGALPVDISGYVQVMVDMPAGVLPANSLQYVTVVALDSLHTPMDELVGSSGSYYSIENGTQVGDDYVAFDDTSTWGSGAMTMIVRADSNGQLTIGAFITRSQINDSSTGVVSVSISAIGNVVTT